LYAYCIETQVLYQHKGKIMSPAPLTLATLPASLPPLSRLLVSLALVLAQWDDRRRTRRSLEKLDGIMLRDIGLDPNSVMAECRKPFWRD
jgi:uncharacterized protein YjiS (DUF1127 family)